MKKQEIIRETSLSTLNNIIATYNENGYVIMPGSLQLITSTKTNFWIVILEKDLVINNYVPVKKDIDITQLVLDNLKLTNNKKAIEVFGEFACLNIIT